MNTDNQNTKPAKDAKAPSSRIFASFALFVFNPLRS